MSARLLHNGARGGRGAALVAWRVPQADPAGAGPGRAAAGAGINPLGEPVGSRAWLGWRGKPPCGDEPEQRLGQTVRVRDVSAGLVAID